MRRLLSVLSLLVVLTLPTAVLPQPASADIAEDFSEFVCKQIFSSCQPFKTNACSISSVEIGTAQPSKRLYKYEGNCNGVLDGQWTASGVYNADTSEAQEKLKAHSGAWTVSATWRCPIDPWAAADVWPACVSVQTLVNVHTDLSTSTSASPTEWAGVPISVTWLWMADGGRPLTSLPHTILNPAPAPLPPSPPAPDPGPSWPNLRTGASGEPVRTLQYLLRHHGLDVVVDGDFGEQTAAAVAQFRSSHNLKAGIGRSDLNQIVTSATWNALVMTLKPGAQGDAVAAVQSALASRGMEVAVDGDFGDQTAAAVWEYRSRHNLKAGIGRSDLNEIVTLTTWAALVNGE